MIDYLFFGGALPTVTEVGVSCFLAGIVVMFLAGKWPMMGGVGLLFALGAAIIATAWWFIGPFSVAWIIVPTVLFAINILFARSNGRRAFGQNVLAAGLFLGMSGTVAYHVDKTIEESHRVIRLPLGEDFCPGEVSKSPTGNLLTDKFIPLRAVARLPNIRLSFSDAVDDLSQHAGIMRPWIPYYVFDRRNSAIQIAESPRAKDHERRWVSRGESFCWTTRECINVERPMSIYSESKDALAYANPLEQGYTFRFGEHIAKGGKKQARFEMPCMPILSRKEHVWAFVRPEGKAQEGYQVSWLQWDDSNSSASNSAVIRIRVTRREMDEYIVGLQKLLIEHRNPGKRETAKREMYGMAGDFISSSKRDNKGAFQLVTTRLKGIPKLDGFMARPPENDLEVKKIKDDIKYLLRFQNTKDNWDAYDIAYPLLAKLP